MNFLIEQMNLKRHKKNINQLYLLRYWFLRCFFVLVGLSLISRAVFLQVYKQEFLKNEGDKRIVRYESIPAYRGSLFDRQDNVLAVSTLVKSIYVNPQILINSSEKWRVLAKKLDISLLKLKKIIVGSSRKEFVYLKRQVTPSVAEEILALKIPGIYTIDENKRFYPASEVTAQLIGMVGVDGNGQEGLELSYNRILSGEKGKVKVYKDRLGYLINEEEIMKNAASGKNINLSIDLRLQYVSYRELKKAVVDNQAESGSLVMLDVNTGEVLAMVNYPSYNPNDRKNLQTMNMRNRVVTDEFEPGSTLKPFIAAAALETNKYYRDTIVNTGNGSVQVGSNVVRDLSGYGELSLEEILVKSSNVGISKVAVDIGSDKVLDLLTRVGIGQAVGSGFPGEGSGSLPFVERWTKFRLSTLSFGYGLTVTPLQLAQAYMVLGSGGMSYPISLLKLKNPPVGVRVLRENIAKKVVKMLSSVIRDGSGKRAALNSYVVAGKTGTVRKVEKHGYSKNRHVGLFAGLAPANNPKFATVVIIDEPSNGKFYGGQTAAPVFSKVNAYALRIMGVKPHQTKTKTMDDTKSHSIARSYTE